MLLGENQSSVVTILALNVIKFKMQDYRFESGHLIHRMRDFGISASFAWAGLVFCHLNAL